MRSFEEIQAIMKRNFSVIIEETSQKELRYDPEFIDTTQGQSSTAFHTSPGLAHESLLIEATQNTAVARDSQDNSKQMIVVDHSSSLYLNLGAGPAGDPMEDEQDIEDDGNNYIKRESDDDMENDGASELLRKRTPTPEPKYPWTKAHLDPDYIERSRSNGLTVTRVDDTFEPMPILPRRRMTGLSRYRHSDRKPSKRTRKKLASEAKARFDKFQQETEKRRLEYIAMFETAFQRKDGEDEQ
ncbi:hypothetical protein B0O99DRAFT_591593 [Bisporella sp. PMI_857]|nr:hypothetical protein B0O99DRAFT_591593 [Bisporella sp. PMI_857]